MPHFGRTAERLRLTTGRVSLWAQVRGGDQQGEGVDDDGDAEVVEAVPAVHLLLPVGGSVLRGPRLAPVVDRDEQRDREPGRSGSCAVVGRGWPWSAVIVRVGVSGSAGSG